MADTDTALLTSRAFNLQSVIGPASFRESIHTANSTLPGSTAKSGSGVPRTTPTCPLGWSIGGPLAYSEQKRDAVSGERSYSILK